MRVLGEGTLSPTTPVPKTGAGVGTQQGAPWSCSYSPLKYADSTYKHSNPSDFIFIVSKGTEMPSSSGPVHLY